MFFRKKTASLPTKVAKKGIKKMDTVVTGVLLGGVVASIYGVKKLQEKDPNALKGDTPRTDTSPEKPKGFWKRLFHR